VAINYHAVREAAAAKILRVGTKEDGMTNLADLFTKVLTADRRRSLCDHIVLCENGDEILGNWLTPFTSWAKGSVRVDCVKRFMLHVFHSGGSMNRGDRLNLDGMDGKKPDGSSCSRHWCLRRRVSTREVLG